MYKKLSVLNICGSMLSLLVTCPQWLSAVLRDELQWYDFVVDNTFLTGCLLRGNEKTMMECNLRSRVASKVYVQLASWKVADFDALFALLWSIDWSDYIAPLCDMVVMLGWTHSTLHSQRAVQSVAHKAILTKLTGSRDVRWQIDDRKIKHEIFLYMDGDSITVYVNTSWSSLHERWYRKQSWWAPIKENLAAGLLLLSGRDKKSAFHDPFCGSGTLCIEAAMLASNTAPGLFRSFAFEVFPSTDGESFIALRDAVAWEKTEISIPIYGSDIDGGVLTIARENTAIAWFSDAIVYLQQDVMELERLSGYCVTNPPYGKRVLSDYAFTELYSHVFSLIIQVGWWCVSGWSGVRSIPLSTDFRGYSLMNGNDKVSFYVH